MRTTFSTGGFKATAVKDGQIIETDEFDYAHEAWGWLTTIRDEQDAAAGLEHTPTAERLHEIRMAVQKLGELVGTGTAYGPVSGENQIAIADDLTYTWRSQDEWDSRCSYKVESLRHPSRSDR